MPCHAGGGQRVELTGLAPKRPKHAGELGPHKPSLPFSDFGFKMSEDLFLEVCVPDPEFSGKPYSPPVPCPVGSTYRKTRGYVSRRSTSGSRGSALGTRGHRTSGYLSHSKCRLLSKQVSSSLGNI